jgi:hypothetical protein
LIETHAEQNHWSECGRSTSLADSSAEGYSHRSVPSFGESADIAMIETPKCSKCGGEMEEGFVLDRHYSAKWVAGEPKTSFPGPRVWGKEQHEIHMFCCKKCGYLEGYVSRE